MGIDIIIPEYPNDFLSQTLNCGDITYGLTVCRLRYKNVYERTKNGHSQVIVLEKIRKKMFENILSSMFFIISQISLPLASSRRKYIKYPSRYCCICSKLFFICDMHYS